MASLRLVAPAVLVLAVAAGCGGSSSATGSATTTTTFPKAFCAAAMRYENELVREASTDKRDLAKQLTIVTQLAATAPPQVRADAQTFLSALQRVAHDPKVRDNAGIKRAVDNVNRYASNRCGFFTQQGGGI